VRRLIIGFILVLAVVWTAGLFLFINSLPKPATDAPPKGDGIVVYTGGGGARISAGMEIFEKGGGDRLLISGVHPGTSRARVNEFWTGEQGLFDCCVDLGREALSTEGNAEEVTSWAEQLGYSSLVLVTSEYHMPRAITATKVRMPDIVIIPYAVASGYIDDKGRPSSLEAWRKLASEYSKFLIAHVRALFASFGR
jgi:uncharacterized SAM-binding protein YcdF (DUF218 family)